MEPLDLSSKTPRQRRKVLFSYFILMCYTLFQLHAASRFECQNSPPASQGNFFFYTAFFNFIFSPLFFNCTEPLNLSSKTPRQCRKAPISFILFYLFSFSPMYCSLFELHWASRFEFQEVPASIVRYLCFSFVFPLFNFSFFFFFFYHLMVISSFPARNLFPCHFILWDLYVFLCVIPYLNWTLLVSV